MLYNTIRSDETKNPRQRVKARQHGEDPNAIYKPKQYCSPSLEMVDTMSVNQFVPPKLENSLPHLESKGTLYNGALCLYSSLLRNFTKFTHNIIITPDYQKTCISYVLNTVNPIICNVWRPFAMPSKNLKFCNYGELKGCFR